MPNIDDTDPAISYSEGWIVQGSLHSTTSVGSTATIRFTGTEINAYFTNPIGNGEIQATFTLDGRDFVMPPRHMHYVAYPNDDFFQSRRDYGTLSPGTHTLVVRNTGSQGPLNLDYFVIDGSVERPAAQAPPPTTQNQGGLLPSTTVVTRIQTVTDTQTTTATSASTFASRPTSSSSSSASTSTTSTSSMQTASTTAGSLHETLSTDPQSGQTVTKFQVVTTSYSGVGVVTISPNGDQGLNVGASGKNVPVGAIVGAVMGSVAFLLLVVLLVLLCLRRRRRAAALSSQYGQGGSAEGGMREINAPGAALSAFTLSSRTHQGGAGHGSSKLRSQGHNRGFSRLEDHFETTGLDTSTPSSPSPSLTLGTYPNEKDISIMDTVLARGRSEGSDGATSFPSPIVSPGYLFSDTASQYDTPPPAYRSGRDSHLYPSVVSRT